MIKRPNNPATTLELARLNYLLGYLAEFRMTAANGGKVRYRSHLRGRERLLHQSRDV